MVTPLVLACFWIALSVWLGGVLFIAMATPIIHMTCSEADPTIANIRSVNLEEQHGTLLAGTIMGRLLKQLGTVQLICAGICLISLMALAAAGNLNDRVTDALRALLLLAATGLALWERFTLSPRLMAARDEFVLYADEPELANPAKDRMDRLQEGSARLLMISAALLVGAVVFSSTGRTVTAFNITTSTTRP